MIRNEILFCGNEMVFRDVKNLKCGKNIILRKQNIKTRERKGNALEQNIILREQNVILKERNRICANEIHFMGTKSVYVLLCPSPGSVEIEAITQKAI